MNVVHAIFKAFKGPTGLADATRLPMKTVFSWKEEPANIPPWRRPVVLEAIRRERVELPQPVIEYLLSEDRAPKEAA